MAKGNWYEKYCADIAAEGGAAGLADSETAAGNSASTEDDVGSVESDSFLNSFLAQGQDASNLPGRGLSNVQCSVVPLLRRI